MTIERLEQYADLRKEVADLARRRDLAAQRAKEYTRAVVQASATEFPYQRHTAIVKGNSVRSAKIYAILSRQYSRKQEVLLLELIEIEAWLDTTQDAKARQLIRHHYIDGLTWAKAAKRVYGYPCEDAARKYVERFMEKILRMSVLSASTVI